MTTSDQEDGKVAATAPAWLARDPISDLRLALDLLEGKAVPQAELLLRWAFGHSHAGAVFRGHRDWVTSATVSPDGRSVVTASFDSTLRVWDMATGDQLATFNLGASSY